MNDHPLTPPSRPAKQQITKRVAVIGAGISGLTCARILVGEVCQVTVFDKSRGVGGRMSTRRTADSLQFDHGAQYFTVRDPRFAESVDTWLRDGVVARWKSRIVVLESGVIDAEKGDTARFVATPSMSAICKQLAKGIEVRLATEVAPPRRVGNHWRLSSGTEDLGEFDSVIVSAPPAQSASLLAASPKLAAAADSVAMHGCWALMLAFEQSSTLEYSGAFVHDSPITWIARNSDKPERPNAPETWVIHASPEWTNRHLDLSGEQIQPMLLDAFWHATQLQPQTMLYSAVHRWRYALPPEPLADSCLFDVALHIGACGDWCGGARVEGAFLSGLAVAEQLLSAETA